MKVLTLTQPWATLVAIGAKKIETRSWSTRYRGPLAIHAAAGLGPVGGRRGLMRLCYEPPFYEALKAAGYVRAAMPMIDDLPRGAIVAVCRVAHIGETTNDGYKLTDLSAPLTVTLPAQELAFGDYSPGRYAWLLADIRALPEPIPARGAVGLWDYTGELPL